MTPIIFNILALLAVCATAAMHWLGVYHSMYWMHPLFWDIPTHMLGGLTIGLWAAAVASRYNLKSIRAAFAIIALTLVVGTAWEIWELLETVSGGWGGYWFDTIKDLCDDTFGACIAWLLYAWAHRTKK